MKFIAALDYKHLDNGMFLSSFARSLSKKSERGIIIHGDSEYTNRIIQTGVMREEATIRATKDLNHRLVALFADEGVPAIALNGYQKSMITIDQDEIQIDINQIKNLPGETVILISNLVLNENQTVQPVSLSKLSDALRSAFDLEHIILFSTKDGADMMVKEYPKIIQKGDKSDESALHQVPEEFKSIECNIKLTTPSVF
ncbi:MAG: hypothetical protein JJU37_10435 [Balneolaceae bacterium]|nr:hypothetical protein [Balneolaceae bacterium]